MQFSTFTRFLISYLQTYRNKTYWNSNLCYSSVRNSPEMLSVQNPAKINNKWKHLQPDLKINSLRRIYFEHLLSYILRDICFSSLWSLILQIWRTWRRGWEMLLLKVSRGPIDPGRKYSLLWKGCTGRALFEHRPNHYWISARNPHSQYGKWIELP